MLIIKDDKGYRLIVIGDERTLTDKYYKTEKGAKIAFLKLYFYRAINEKTNPIWMKSAHPFQYWMDELLSKPGKPLY